MARTAQDPAARQHLDRVIVHCEMAVDLAAFGRLFEDVGIDAGMPKPQLKFADDVGC